MNKKQIVDLFLDNKSAERVPVAFWSHFVSFHDHHRGVSDEGVLKNVYEGQKKFYEMYKPDFLKIMSDGFFGHPAMVERTFHSVEDLKKIESCGRKHPFITKQIEYVKEICDYVDGEVYTFYNIFSPLQYIRLKIEEYDEDFEIFSKLFVESPEEMVGAASRIAEDILILVDEIFSKTRVDGIYYSVQSVQHKKADHEFHKAYVEPLDRLILNEILKYTDKVILHVCGYAHYTNDLTWYKDYPVKAFNWAVFTENIGLAEGKKLLNGKPVLGGFDNNPESILYSANMDEYKKYIYEILDQAGTNGIAIGADCTVSNDFTPERYQDIIQVVSDYKR
ncbi:MAG: uroporphyrinogen decarboxylase family protein [Peptoniphilaceae bacterium]|nr:uroporphyrinogen decarboxylase family protein [Peptoniphilaceae bacterium]MDY3076437.1 uroporphyrinogen decarboxylase family protein [Peptoniphilaceae bacterium]